MHKTFSNFENLSKEISSERPQPQSHLLRPRLSAPCPCGSGHKLRDCCGKRSLREPGEVTRFDSPGASPDPTLEDIDSLILHYQDVETWFNRELEKHGWVARVDTTAQQQVLRPANGTDKREFLSEDNVRTWSKRRMTGVVKSGILHEPQVVTLVEATSHLRDNGQPLLIVGPPQCGKTTINVGLLLAGPMAYLETYGTPKEVKYEPILLLPNANSMYKEAKDSLNNFIDLYGKMHIRFPGKKSISLAEYLGLSNSNTGEAFITLVHYETQGLRRDNIPEPLAISKRGTTDVKPVTNRIQRSLDKGFSPLIVVDEEHFGALDRPDSDGEHRYSVLGEILNCTVSYKGSLQPLLKVCADRNERPCIVNVSATPYTSYELGLAQIEMWYDDTYRGFTYFDGKPVGRCIGDITRVQQPGIRSFSDAGSEFGIENMVHFSYSAYRSYKSFRDLDFMVGDYTGYQAWFEDQLVRLIIGCVQDGSDVVFRLRTNRESAILRGKIEDRVKSSAQIIEWNNGEGGDKTLAEQMAEARRKNPRLSLVVFVTARLRMADPVPSSVHRFVEFTKRHSTVSASEQGFLGRACGYGKGKTMVYYNDAEADRMQNYVTNGLRDLSTAGLSKAAAGVTIPKTEKNNRANKVFKIRHEVEGSHPMLRTFFDLVNRYVRTQIDDKKLPGIGRGHHIPLFDLWEGRPVRIDGTEEVMDWEHYGDLGGFMREEHGVSLKGKNFATLQGEEGYTLMEGKPNSIKVSLIPSVVREAARNLANDAGFEVVVGMLRENEKGIRRDENGNPLAHEFTHKTKTGKQSTRHIAAEEGYKWVVDSISLPKFENEGDVQPRVIQKDVWQVEMKAPNGN